MPEPYPIFALWAHPRSMSTAFERVMRERGDLDCLHEPFMHDYYIHQQTRRMPMFDPDAGHPTSYAQVRAMINARAEAGPVFLKDMSYYVYPHLLEDRAFCDQMRHAFLLRDPMASIASYVQLDPDVTLVEIGIEAQWLHFQALRQQGHRPVVLLAEEVRADPQAMIGAYWQAVGLADAPQAFAWQGAAPDDWQQVAGWHGDVIASQGIKPPSQAEQAKQRQRFEDAAKLRPDLRDMLEHHREFHQRLVEHALRPGASGETIT